MKKQNWEILLINVTGKTVPWSEKDEERIILSLFGRSRKSVVTSRVKMPKKKSDDFWKLYQDFQARKRKISHPEPVVKQQADQSADTIAYLAKHEKDGAKLLGKLYRNYFKLFKRLIKGEAASNLLQLDMQIDSSIAAISATNDLPASQNHEE